MQDEWPCWRLVVADQVVTLEELETHWSLNDVVRATLIQDALGAVRRPK